MRSNRRMGLAAGLSVAVVAPAASGQGFLIFASRSQFNEFIKGPPPHCLFKGLEDFEESTLLPGLSLVMDDPLAPGVANGPFLAGLSQGNLRVQSNTLGGAPVVPSPRGPGGLYTEATLGPFGDVVLANTPADSLDLLFPLADKCAVAFDVLALGAPAGVQVSVFDTTNAMVAQGVVAPGSFFGIARLNHPNQIGRINVFALSATGIGVREGADNISLYVEVPAPAGLLVLLAPATVLARRRRAR